MIGNRTRRASRPRAGGFTLLEVMISLAILVVGIVGIIGRVASNIQTTQELTLRGVAVDLARGKMYDVEEKLIKDGFQELEQSEDGDFGDEGYPNIEWEAVVEKVEMPGLGAMQALEGGEAAAGEGGALEDSPLGGFMAGFGGGGEGLGVGAGLISGYFEMITKGMEASIRKVTLTLTWKVGREEEKLVVACYFTNPAGLDQGIGGALNALGGGSGGSGSDSSGGSGGSGSGSGSGGPRSGSGSPRGNPRSFPGGGK